MSVEGDLAWCEKYRTQLTEPDYVIYVSDEDTLNKLGVKVLDLGWKPGDPGISLDKFVRASFEKE